MTRWIKWGVIAVLVAALVYGGYVYGRSVEAERQAQARTEAVNQARQEAREKVRQLIRANEKLSKKHAQRVEALRDKVDDLKAKAERYAESDAGRKSCFDAEGTERFNAL